MIVAAVKTGIVAAFEAVLIMQVWVSGAGTSECCSYSCLPLLKLHVNSTRGFPKVEILPVSHMAFLSNR